MVGEAKNATTKFRAPMTAVGTAQRQERSPVAIVVVLAIMDMMVKYASTRSHAQLIAMEMAFPLERLLGITVAVTATQVGLAIIATKKFLAHPGTVQVMVAPLALFHEAIVRVIVTMAGPVRIARTKSLARILAATMVRQRALLPRTIALASAIMDILVTSARMKTHVPTLAVAMVLPLGQLLLPIALARATEATVVMHARRKFHVLSHVRVMACPLALLPRTTAHASAITVTRVPIAKM